MPPASLCDHLSVDSSQYSCALVDVPLSTSIPESSLGVPVSLLLRVIILSSISTTSEFLVVWFPDTIRSPWIVTAPLKCAVEVIEDSNDYETVFVSVKRPSDTTITIAFGAAVTAGAYRAFVTKMD